MVEEAKVEESTEIGKNVSNLVSIDVFAESREDAFLVLQAYYKTVFHPEFEHEFNDYETFLRTSWGGLNRAGGFYKSSHPTESEPFVDPLTHQEKQAWKVSFWTDKRATFQEPYKQKAVEFFKELSKGYPVQISWFDDPEDMAKDRSEIWYKDNKYPLEKSNEAITPYKSTVLEKLRLVEELLASATPVEALTEEEVSSSIAYLNHLMDNPHHVVEDIHDLWSARQFTNGFLYGNETNLPKKTHRLLTPYSMLEDKELEDKIAQGDIKGIKKVILSRFPNADSTKSLSLELLSNEQKSAIVKVMFALAQDKGAIEEMSKNVHETWCEAKRQRGFTEQSDAGVGAEYDSLDTSAKLITYANARLDILAVALSVTGS